jgi:hypothetical protein
MLTVGGLLPSLKDLPGPDPVDLAQPIDLDRPTSRSLCAAVDAIGAAQRASCEDNDLEEFQHAGESLHDIFLRDDGRDGAPSGFTPSCTRCFW